MRYTISFIIILVFVSGFIAYIGDFLGRKMGKKRLTLFGLRPRHTAIVVTTITGMVIAAATLATIVSVSSSIREVLIAGEQKIAQNKVLTHENKFLQSSNTKLQQKEATLRRDWEEARQSLLHARSARDEAAAKVASLSTLIDAQIKDLNDLRSKKNLTEAQLAAKIRVLQTLEKEFQVTQNKLEQTNEKLASAQKELDNADRIFKDQLATIAEQERAIKEYNTQIQDQRTRIASLGQEKRELNQKNQKLGQQYLKLDNFMRFKKFVLNQGQELTRVVVSQNQSPYSVRADVLSLLDKASDEAKEAGASVGKNERYIFLVAPGVSIDEPQCIDAATESIVKSNTPVLAQVLVAENTVEGEPAAVMLQLYRNDLAFSKGNRVASAMIDGRKSEGKILLSVINFLRSDVRKAADNAGVVPIASPEPDIQGDQQFDELMDLVSKIKQINTPIRLRVTAEKDIYAAGPLNLNNLEFAISTKVAQLRESR